MSKKAYRITERVMSDGTYQFVPEACDNKHEGDSLWKSFLEKFDPEIWYSVADTLHQIEDTGYKTYEKALNRLVVSTLEKPQQAVIQRVVIHDVNL